VISGPSLSSTSYHFHQLRLLGSTKPVFFSIARPLSKSRVFVGQGRKHHRTQLDQYFWPKVLTRLLSCFTKQSISIHLSAVLTCKIALNGITAV